VISRYSPSSLSLKKSGGGELGAAEGGEGRKKKRKSIFYDFNSHFWERKKGGNSRSDLRCSRGFVFGAGLAGGKWCLALIRDLGFL